MTTNQYNLTIFDHSIKYIPNIFLLSIIYSTQNYITQSFLIHKYPVQSSGVRTTGETGAITPMGVLTKCVDRSFSPELIEKVIRNK